MRKKIEHCLNSYGIYPVLICLKYFEEVGQFERCKEIVQVVKGRSKYIGEEVPLQLSEDWREDYKAEFWRLGLDGKTVDNIYEYVHRCLSHLEEDYDMGVAYFVLSNMGISCV